MLSLQPLHSKPASLRQTNTVASESPPLSEAITAIAWVSNRECVFTCDDHTIYAYDTMYGVVSSSSYCSVNQYRPLASLTSAQYPCCIAVHPIFASKSNQGDWVVVGCTDGTR